MVNSLSVNVASGFQKQEINFLPILMSINPTQWVAINTEWLKILGKLNSMFGKNKNAILHTYLIVKVRKYEDQQPYFSLYSTPAIADQTKAYETIEKLNSLAELTKEKGWQEEYYSVHMTL